ncbi:MAG: hypothetical protein R3C41_22925 [Calditrichia bacterium]
MSTYYVFEKPVRIERKNTIAGIVPKWYYRSLLNEAAKVASEAIKKELHLSGDSVSFPLHVSLRVYVRIAETDGEVIYKKVGRYLFTINKL